ncbi:selenoprotein S [Frankliniella occidentalis]|uniref:Selenoprotein S n=1 Tax=Frankliniella occidentalis TaxID=133901 RepID=A0A6J1SB32_FRAOC|nr:selenoprotein S [Frankliniella occidentalis]
MEEAKPIHPESLEQPTPALISEAILFVQQIYATYGWYILGSVILGLYVWSKVKPHYEKWRKQKEDDEYAAKVHKNPDLYRARQEAIVAARLRMQEEHDRMAKVKAERAKELEDQKREDWIARQSGSGGQRLGNQQNISNTEPQPGPSKKKSSSFKPEYNPLMGAGSSGGYRPQKRGCPGGGCGKK